LNIVVCIKRVPDSEARIRIEGTDIERSGVKFVMSPYDEFAVEAALRTREANGEGTVTVMTLGDESSQETLRSALAMGADGAVLLNGSVTMDGLATAKALAAELEGMDAPLVLFGVKSADDDQQQVGPMVATLLGRAGATAVSSFEVSGGELTAQREVDGGTEVLSMPLPAVLSITKGAFEPRYASLKGIMMAKKKPLEQKEAQGAESRLTVVSVSEPAERAEGRIVGEGPEAASELVRLLREEAKAL
jgi:electron transfer flavoprotein beta subunit